VYRNFGRQALGPPFHIYPFDTGAGASGCYGTTVDPHVYLEDYELKPDAAARRRDISPGHSAASLQYFEGDLIPVSSKACTSAVSRRGWLTMPDWLRQEATDPTEGLSYRSRIFSEPALKGHARLVIFPQQLLEDDRVHRRPYNTTSPGNLRLATERNTRFFHGRAYADRPAHLGESWPAMMSMRNMWGGLELVGYEKVTDHGLALPVFGLSRGANVYYTARSHPW